MHYCRICSGRPAAYNRHIDAFLCRPHWEVLELPWPQQPEPAPDTETVDGAIMTAAAWTVVAMWVVVVVLAVMLFAAHC